MRSNLLPRAKGNCRTETKHPAPSFPTPYRLLWSRPSETTTRAGRPGGICNKDVQSVAFGSLNRDELQYQQTDPCSEFTQPASTASGSRMQSRPFGIEAIGRNLARHGLRACSLSRVCKSPDETKMRCNLTLVGTACRRLLRAQMPLFIRARPRSGPPIWEVC
jgi:hypothetical protein